MTFSDIQSRVLNRCNLSSSDATTRVGQSINEAYKMLVSSLGLDVVQRVVGVSATTIIGSRSLTFGLAGTPVEKILSLYNPLFSPPMVLAESDMDTLRNEPVLGDPPTEYAIQNIGPDFVTVYLNVQPSTAYVLLADVLSNASTLSDTMQPQFPEDFHDCLERHAMAVELEKMEKYEFAAKQEAAFEQRVSDLRYYLAKSAYKDVYQGKNQGISPTR